MPHGGQTFVGSHGGYLNLSLSAGAGSQWSPLLFDLPTTSRIFWSPPRPERRCRILAHAIRKPRLVQEKYDSSGG